jgi:hypothetical protein
MVTEAPQAGLTLTSIAGNGWTCSAGAATCMRNDSLGAGTSYPAITATFHVDSNAPASLGNQVTVSGGGSGSAMAADTANVAVYTCDLDSDGSATVADIQKMINEALGLAPPSNDLTYDGLITVADVQKVIDSTLGMGCSH